MSIDRAELDMVRAKIERIEEELSSLKRWVLLQAAGSGEQQPWHKWQELSASVSELWQGPGAVDEIREQRTKPYSHAIDPR